MASGSHTYRGIWADFPTAPTKNRSVMMVASCPSKQVGGFARSRRNFSVQTPWRPAIRRGERSRSGTQNRPPARRAARHHHHALFFVGAVGKSAPDPPVRVAPRRHGGPTPVSSLIHAATMVTAGVYMIARLNFLLQHGARHAPRRCDHRRPHRLFRRLDRLLPRTTSRRSWPTPPSASSGSCSSPWASEPMRPASST